MEKHYVTRQKWFVLNAVMLFLSLTLAMAFSEVLLRVFGFQPWSYNTKSANEPTMHEPDAILGWQNKAGSYTVPPYHPSGETIHITFIESGRRRTAVNPPRNPAGELVLIGDSFTVGWAISDSETYPWQLQEKFPFLHVLNYGTGGYGSYQSLLMLERELPSLAHPKFVLYGFNQLQEARNTAPARWLRLLSSHSRRGHVDVPFATFDAEKGMLRHPPERYVSLPLRESSAVVTLVEKAYMDIKARKRLSNKRLITEQILLAMDRVSKEHNAIFAVVLLWADRNIKEHYMEYLRENNIQVIDCIYEITNEMQVPGDGHPNGKMHALWTKCISDALYNQFESSKLSNELRIHVAH
jgi:hypothetical protein